MSKYKEDIIQLRKQNKSYREIEDRINCSKSTIAYHCQKEGLEDIGKKVKEISDEKKKAIRETYENKTAEKTSEIHNVSESTVKKYGKTKSRSKSKTSTKKVKSRKEFVKTKQYKGILAEEQVKTRLTSLGYVVLEPNRKKPYDFAAEYNGNFIRIEVKYGRYKNGKIIANLVRKTTNTNKCKSYIYSEEEVDYFAVYSEKTEEVYIINSDIENKTNVSLRIKDAKNNRKKGIRRAENYVLNEKTKLVD